MEEKIQLLNVLSGGCARQLSTNTMHFLFSVSNLLSSLFKYSKNITWSIQADGCDLYLVGKLWTYLKQWGFSLFPITSSGNFSPAILPPTKTVNRSLLCLTPRKLGLADSFPVTNDFPLSAL